MLLQLTPDAVTNSWDELSEEIQKALSDKERSQAVMNNLLNELLLQRASCWISYDDQDDNSVNGCLVLSVHYDEFNHEKNLNVFALVKNSKFIGLQTTMRMYQEGIAGLRKYMQANGFRKLTGFVDTDKKRHVKTLEAAGFKFQYQIEMDMGD